MNEELAVWGATHKLNLGSPKGWFDDAEEWGIILVDPEDLDPKLIKQFNEFWET